MLSIAIRRNTAYDYCFLRGLIEQKCQEFKLLLDAIALILGCPARAA
jgi:hypothetical protein